MISRQQAITADTFHWGNCTRETGPRGGVTVRSVVYRRNGATKTWRTRPEDYRVPVKHGLRDYAYITPELAPQWHTADECPLADGHDHCSGETHAARVQPVSISIMPSVKLWRVVCTCGLITTETHYQDIADAAMRYHLANYQESAAMLNGRMKQGEGLGA